MDIATHVRMGQYVVRAVTYRPRGKLLRRMHLSLDTGGQSVTIRDMTPSQVEDLGGWLIERAVIAKMQEGDTDDA